MKDEILIDNIKFWVDQHIIYCKLYNDFDENYSQQAIEKIFIEAISILSEGSIMPILFNFRELNNSLAIKLFRLINNSNDINRNVLSKAILVNNYSLKFLFSFYVMFSNSILPITIFNEAELAVKFCNKNRMFLLRQVKTEY